MPDDAAKGFGRKAPLDAAAAEGVKLCAAAASQTHTCQHHSAHQPSPACGLEGGLGIELIGFESSRNLLTSAFRRLIPVMFTIRRGNTKEGVAYAPWWMPVLMGFFPVQSSAENGQQLGNQLAKQPTPAGNVHHGPPSSYEPSSSLLVKAHAHVPNVPYIAVYGTRPAEHRITRFPFITQANFHGSGSRSPRELSESTTGATTTLAGNSYAGFNDHDVGALAQFDEPHNVAIDPSGAFALVAVRACPSAPRASRPSPRSGAPTLHTRPRPAPPPSEVVLAAATPRRWLAPRSACACA